MGAEENLRNVPELLNIVYSVEAQVIFFRTVSSSRRSKKARAGPRSLNIVHGKTPKVTKQKRQFN